MPATNAESPAENAMPTGLPPVPAAAGKHPSLNSPESSAEAATPPVRVSPGSDLVLTQQNAVRVIEGTAKSAVRLALSKANVKRDTLLYVGLAAVGLGLISCVLLVAIFVQAWILKPAPTAAKFDVTATDNAEIQTNRFNELKADLKRMNAKPEADPAITAASTKLASDVATIVGKLNKPPEATTVTVPQQLTNDIAALKKIVDALAMKPDPLKADELAKQLTELTKTLRATPTASAPAVAKPAEVPRSLDVLLLCCHSAFDGRQMSQLYIDAAARMPAEPTTRLSIRFSLGEAVQIVRPFAPRSEVKLVLADAIRKIDEPNGVEKPGRALLSVKTDMTAARKVAILLISTAAEAPDVSQAGDATPHVLMIKMPNQLIDPVRLEAWAEFVGQRNGTLTLYPIAKTGVADYKLLELQLTQSIARIFASLKESP